ncbi:helix-turn-helix transcriptional regulator [Salinivibrio costicola]|uniref:Helix-turn-helix transcriptional regulator n=1 Tax=Salinivibrio costicola TaxID=51367 RepID=A0ABX6KBM4_SALCS|nr:helix-turn-helix transcriptional regulator [Salinivibrio costicola]QIR08041.1 helix-turn-helix transcriptional regulator [Salinivibrio costicola]
MDDHTDDLNVFANRLQYARKRQLLSQVAAAKSLGIARMTYVDWEKGKRSPTLETVVKISECLNVDKHWLAFGEFGANASSERQQLEEVYE